MNKRNEDEICDQWLKSRRNKRRTAMVRKHPLKGLRAYLGDVSRMRKLAARNKRLGHKYKKWEANAYKSVLVARRIYDRRLTPAQKNKLTTEEETILFKSGVYSKGTELRTQYENILALQSAMHTLVPKKEAKRPERKDVELPGDVIQMGNAEDLESISEQSRQALDTVADLKNVLDNLEARLDLTLSLGPSSAASETLQKTLKQLQQQLKITEANLKRESESRRRCFDDRTELQAESDRCQQLNIELQQAVADVPVLEERIDLLVRERTRLQEELEASASRVDERIAEARQELQRENDNLFTRLRECQAENRKNGRLLEKAQAENLEYQELLAGAKVVVDRLQNQVRQNQT